MRNVDQKVTDEITRPGLFSRISLIIPLCLRWRRFGT